MVAQRLTPLHEPAPPRTLLAHSLRRWRAMAARLQLLARRAVIGLRRRTLFPKKKWISGRGLQSTHTHFSDFDCRAHVSSSEPWSARLNLSPKSSTMHPNMCDHACMRAHACTHACTRRMRRVVCSVSRYTRSLHGSSFWAPADSAECMLNQVRGLISSINKTTHSLEATDRSHHTASSTGDSRVNGEYSESDSPRVTA